MSESSSHDYEVNVTSTSKEISLLPIVTSAAATNNYTILASITGTFEYFEYSKYKIL